MYSAHTDSVHGFLSPVCARCKTHNLVCIPWTRSGKACGPCAASRAVCSFTGRLATVGLSTSAGLDAVREALVPWLQKVNHAVRTQHTLIQNMSVEIFAWNLGVQPEDEEWGVCQELND
jgi:hypothetical protein